MCLKTFGVAVLLLSATGVCAAGDYVVPTTTLAAQTASNTSAANGFAGQANGNNGAGNVSKVDVHSLLYPGASTKVYAHLLLWFGGSNHMNVGYSSTDAAQIHRQITDMISRGIDGVIVDWYGPNNSIDQATKLVMAEAERHPGFTFAIMVDQGAIQWNSCPGCSPQQTLISQLQYIEQSYFPSPAYLTQEGKPVVTNFNIDLSYAVDWTTVTAALATQPVFLFQDNDGFSHVLSGGSYSWVMPSTNDYGMGYLASFYDAGMPLTSDQTVGASYKGFNDSLAGWGSGRVMSQQCGRTWLQTFSEANSLYNSGKQLSALQLVTWNDYEEGTEIESGISNCLTLSASAVGSSLQWIIQGDNSTVDHYVAYVSTDGQNLMALGDVNSGTDSLNLCSYSIPDGNYVLYVQAVGKPSITNEISGPVKFASTCAGGSAAGNGTLSFGTNPSSLTIALGSSGSVTVTAVPQSGVFDSAIGLTCSNLPQSLACSFAPASIIPGSGAAQSVLTISSTSVRAMDRGAKRIYLIYGSWLFGFSTLGFVFIGKTQRQRVWPAVKACTLAVVIIGSISCGGSGSSRTGSVGANYAVTIKGTSGSVQLSTTVTVTLH